jgi:hypothetical protein
VVVVVVVVVVVSESCSFTLTLTSSVGLTRSCSAVQVPVGPTEEKVVAVPVVEEEVIVRADDRSVATVGVLVLGVCTLVYATWVIARDEFLSTALGVIMYAAGLGSVSMTAWRLRFPRPPWQIVGKPGRLAWGRVGGDWTEVDLADVQHATVDGLSEETSVVMTLRDGSLITIPGDQIPADGFEAVAWFLRAHSDGEVQVVGKH